MKTSLTITGAQIDALFDRDEMIRKADAVIDCPNPHITDASSDLSGGGAKDYFSTADYWWPDPDKADGLPFIRRDGMSWGGGFFEHRHILRSLRTGVAALAAAYGRVGNEVYAEKAVRMLYEFFLDPVTGMNPNMQYAQAIQGICGGRPVGIIDTLHLIEVPYAIEALKPSPYMSDELYSGLKKWFADYLQWLCTHPYGIEEMNHYNNHAVSWNVQAACFAVFTGNEKYIGLCKELYKNALLPQQMAEDGSFPNELSRTKPYNYSNFILDNMVNICLILSDREDDLWEYSLDCGRNIKKGLEFMLPYVEDITKWPYEKDVQHFEEFPVSMPYLLFAGLRFGDERYIRVYKKYSKKLLGEEMRRNIAIREPYLFL